MTRRCGTGVPLDQLPDGDRQVVAAFVAYLSGEVALAADGVTYVALDDPAAVHRAPPFDGEEPDG